MNMTNEISSRLRRSLFVLVGAGGASFLTMIIIQLFMGGIRSPEVAFGKAFMIGFGMAMFVFLLPSTQRERYPWQ
jgi:hypothetical protein